MKRLLLISCAVLVIGVLAQAAQDPVFVPDPHPVTQAQDKAPTISEVDNLKLTAALQQFEIWELREQQARAEKMRAVDAVNALLRALQRDGYDFDVATRTYKPKKDGGTPGGAR